jgi:hypothetical protein
MSVFDQYNTSESIILFPVVERGTAWLSKEGKVHPTHTHKAIVRVMPDREPHMLNIVGRSYKLVTNRELFTTVEETIEREVPAELLQDIRVTDRVANFGKVCYRDYVFPSTAVKLDTHSQVAFRMIVQNGYGGSALRVHAGAIDFFCTNGMIRGDFVSSYHKHTSGLQVMSFGNVVHRALQSFEESKPMWARWTKTRVQHSAAMELFKELATSQRMVDGLGHQFLEEREHHGDTLWAVYSAMTHFASHNDGEFALRKSAEEQDSVANIMLQRELKVSEWVESEQFKALELA